VTKEEIIAAVKECAEKLGRTPNVEELKTSTEINAYKIRKSFGSYMLLLGEAGLDAKGHGHRAEPRALCLDWAEITRKLKKVPTIAEYQRHSKFSVRPLTTRYKGWKQVAAGMRNYLIENRLDVEWSDIMNLITEHMHPPAKNSIFSKTSSPPSRPRIDPDQPTYGQPLLNVPLTYAPTNENGVLFAFGSVARELGFSVLRIQAAFPDCEAMREVEPGRCQRVRIEFEHQSRNFIAHLHPLAGCDLIVCWEHNWPECPLEVIELRRVIGNQIKREPDNDAGR
jgi:hypothetical protein